MTVYGRDLPARYAVECLHCDFTNEGGAQTANAVRIAVRKHAEETGHVVAMQSCRTRVFRAQPADAYEVDLDRGVA